MIYVKQNDPACYPIIQHSGCFFRSCGLLAEFKTGELLTAEQLNNIWDWAKAIGYINRRDEITKSAEIANMFLRELGNQTGRFIEVGTFSQGKVNYYPGIKKYNPELCRIDALIQKIKQGGPQGTHFRPVDKAGNVLEDPHEPAIKCLGIFYSILYAYEED